jgi:RHS repeat-associated protein
MAHKKLVIPPGTSLQACAGVHTRAPVRVGHLRERHFEGTTHLRLLRLGVYKVPAAGLQTDWNKLTLGRREYEISNHLGNVLATISDVKLPAARVLSHTDYYAFGSAMPGRSGGSPYRHGFNGKENDKDFGNAQLIQDYGFRLYNPAIGKFLSVDPITAEYPELTPYQFASNTPIWAIDLDGLEAYFVHPPPNTTQYGRQNREDIEKWLDSPVSSEAWARQMEGEAGLEEGSIKTNRELSIFTIGWALRQFQASVGSGNARARIPGTPKLSKPKAADVLNAVPTTTIAQPPRIVKAANQQKLLGQYSQNVTHINGTKIINYDKRGQTVQTKSGHAVKFDNDGFPDFTPWSLRTVRVQGLTGDYRTDAKMALAAAGMTSTPDKMVWHHHQDGQSMMLVPKVINNARDGGVAHTGGAAVIDHNKNNPNNQLKFASPPIK